MSRKMQRREFLQTSALAAGAGFWLTGGVTESFAARQNDPMARLNIAIIGAGGQGGGNLNAIANLKENIVALCDVDAARAAGAFKAFPKATQYEDFRAMLEKQKDIEAVVVSTPDHTHAAASLMAMRMGKHCYTEKPLTHNVHEARLMRETAAKHRVATQMGNQGTSNGNLRTAVEIIRSGGIGDVREVHAWTDRPGMYWRQGHRERPKERPDAPRTLNWNLWLGPAAERPYHNAYVPFAWRGWWDFGTGALGDMACHVMNLPFMALELGAPSSISAECDQEINNESPPNGLIVTYEFPARGNRPGVRLKWYEVRRPAQDLFQGQKMSAGGCLIVGARGTLYSPSDYGGEYRLLPEKNFEGFTPPKPTLPRSPGHHAEWIRACKGGAAAMGNFDYSGPLTEMVLLGNVAIRSGKRIVWNAEKMICVDCEAANQYLRREYRKGWTL